MSVLLVRRWPALLAVAFVVVLIAASCNTPPGGEWRA